MLFKAADVANGARKYGKAVQLWGAVWRKHPEHPRAPMALFLQGFTFDSKLGKSNMARKYYMEFLKQYPNDSLATQVKQLLMVVQDSPEDLVKKFKEAEAQ
jgi:TolA-binding protein